MNRKEKSLKNRLWFVLITISITLLPVSCQFFASIVSKEKQPSSFEDTALEKATHHFFWNQLHQGHYDSLEKVLDRLHRAYQKDSRDFKIAAHLGFTYAWMITERRRAKDLSPSIASASDLALTYFDKAVQLNPHDPRLKGFKAGFMLANGDRHQDDELQTKGYFYGKKAIREWPSFNYFSIGYVMSTIDYEDERFREALEFQWKNLEDCLCRKIDRKNPKLNDIPQIPERVRDDYKKSRACTNSWIAPHNVEGFLINLGDMLVKNGDVEAAEEVYHSIKLVKEYDQWPYQEQLEKRLVNLQENVSYFRRPTQILKDNRQVFINTTYGCMGCHQKSKTEFLLQNKSVPLTKKTYFIDKNDDY